MPGEDGPQPLGGPRRAPSVPDVLQESPGPPLIPTTEGRLAPVVHGPRGPPGALSASQRACGPHRALTADRPPLH